MIENWVKVDPDALAQALASLPLEACGEWVIGFQAGAAGAMLGRTATQSESAGHAFGSEARAKALADRQRKKDQCSGAGALGNKVRWGDRETIADATQKSIADATGPATQKSIADKRRGEGIREEQKTTSKRHVFDAAEFDALIPLDFQTPAFADAWHSWVADRKDRKKPMTERAAKGCLSKLRGEAQTPDEATRWIENAIVMGWQGIFRPNVSFPTPTKAPYVEPPSRPFTPEELAAVARL